MSYRVVYERVGRHGGNGGTPAPRPLTVNATDPDDIALLVYRDVRRFVGSREIEVRVDLDTLRGTVVVGWIRTAGTFTLERQE